MFSNQLAPREVGAWAVILEHLQSRVTEQKFDTWYRKLSPLVVTEDVVLLEVPNAFFVDFFEEYNLPTLKDSIQAILGASPPIRFQVRKNGESPGHHATDGVGKSSREGPSSPSLPLMDSQDSERSSPALGSGMSGRRIHLEESGHRNGGGTFRPRFTFDSFVVGRGNEFAYAACQAVANDPARAYNPLFLHGGVGLGKTHLMHAIGAEVSSRNPGAKICYVSTEQFMNEMIESIQRGSTIDFRNRYRKLDMLLIDDIQFLAGKESTQDEFFHTFNTLYGSNRQVVIASDRAPKEIQDLEERLISRFHWGLVSDIQPPDLETRMAILRAKAEEKGLTVPPDVILEIAKLIQTNIRELEGSLIRIKAFADLLRSPINVSLVHDALSDYIRNQARRPIDVQEIQKYAAQAYGVPPESLRGKRRTNVLANARQVAMYLTKELTTLTVVEIGRRFGNRDHSTVLHAVKKVRQMMAEEPEIKQRIEQMKHELESLSQR